VHVVRCFPSRIPFRERSGHKPNSRTDIRGNRPASRILLLPRDPPSNVCRPERFLKAHFLRGEKACAAADDLHAGFADDIAGSRRRGCRRWIAALRLGQPMRFTSLWIERPQRGPPRASSAVWWSGLVSASPKVVHTPAGREKAGVKLGGGPLRWSRRKRPNGRRSALTNGLTAVLRPPAGRTGLRVNVWLY